MPFLNLPEKLILSFELLILDIDITNVDMYGLHSWRNDFANAGIVSFCLIFASLLFSGDLKRIWKWMATSLTDISNEDESKGVYARIFAYCLYSVFVVVVGGWGVILSWMAGVQAGAIDQGFGLIHLISLIFNLAIFGSGISTLYGSLVENKQLLTFSCRITAIFSFFSVFIIFVWTDLGWNLRSLFFFNDEPYFFGLAGCSLLFSGDVKRLWKRILSNETIKQLVEKYW